VDELKIELDLDIGKWPLIDQMDFEKAVKMTVQRAARVMSAAAADESSSVAEQEAAAEAAADIPAAVLVGFVWIAARRKRPGLTFEEAAAAFTADDFMDGIPEEDEAPLATPNREQRRTTGKSSGRSATTSITPRRKSAA
jgi:hypothetical protein